MGSETINSARNIDFMRYPRSACVIVAFFCPPPTHPLLSPLPTPLPFRNPPFRNAPPHFARIRPGRTVNPPARPGIPARSPTLPVCPSGHTPTRSPARPFARPPARPPNPPARPPARSGDQQQRPPTPPPCCPPAPSPSFVSPLLNFSNCPLLLYLPSSL